MAACLGVLFSCTGDRPAPPAVSSTTPASTAAAAPGPGFTLVGHDPLLGRGMNAGLALYGRYAYIGSRTDSSGARAHAGILVVDVADPAHPRVVGEIGTPAQGRPGETSRELRVWPERDLLIVMNIPCDERHACAGRSPAATLRFYDVSGARARAPALVATYVPSVTPHEMFLWQDPARPGRALVYLSTDVSDTRLAGLVVVDVSRARAGSFRELARWRGGDELRGEGINPQTVRLHSMGVSADGNRTYVAHLAGGFLVLDSSDLARAAEAPALRALTPVGRSLRWTPGPHSAIEVPGASLVLTTDEVYGGGRACPWGWARLIDVSDPSRPRLLSELRAKRNLPQACAVAPRDGRYSASAHNPTIAGGVAFVSWHAEGLIAAPVTGSGGFGRQAVFTPDPLAWVATEDPRLTAGSVKVAMWSTPIVSEGLIYVVDIRNGLYVVRYGGPGAGAVDLTGFAEGNSNRRSSRAADAEMS